MACGLTSGEGIDKVRTFGLELEAGHRVEAPRIRDCVAHIECTVVTTLQPGDHTIFVSEVVGVWAEEEAFGETWRASESDDELLPLCHLGERGFCLPGKMFMGEDRRGKTKDR